MQIVSDSKVQKAIAMAVLTVFVLVLPTAGIQIASLTNQNYSLFSPVTSPVTNPTSPIPVTSPINPTPTPITSPAVVPTPTPITSPIVISPTPTPLPATSPVQPSPTPIPVTAPVVSPTPTPTPITPPVVTPSPTPTPSPVSCRVNAPTVILTRSQTTATSGQSVTITIKVINNNEVTCGASDFYITPIIPSAYFDVINRNYSPTTPIRISPAGQSAQVSETLRVKTGTPKGYQYLTYTAKALVPARVENATTTSIYINTLATPTPTPTPSTPPWRLIPIPTLPVEPTI